MPHHSSDWRHNPNVIAAGVAPVAASRARPPAPGPDTGHDAAPGQDWRLAPTVTDRQLVTIVGFIAVTAHIAVTILGWTMLVLAPYGQALPFVVIAAGTGTVTAAGLLGLAGWTLRGFAKRRHTHPV